MATAPLPVLVVSPLRTVCTEASAHHDRCYNAGRGRAYRSSSRACASAERHSSPHRRQGSESPPWLSRRWLAGVYFTPGLRCRVASTERTCCRLVRWRHSTSSAYSRMYLPLRSQLASRDVNTSCQEEQRYSGCPDWALLKHPVRRFHS